MTRKDVNNEAMRIALGPAYAAGAKKRKAVLSKDKDYYDVEDERDKALARNVQASKSTYNGPLKAGEKPIKPKNFVDTVKASVSATKKAAASKKTGGDGGDTDDYTSVYAGLNPVAQQMAANGASAKTLSQYLKEANAGLGKGTDYGSLNKQLASDSSKASKNVGTLYKALSTGIRGNDATLKKIYGDSATQTAAAGSQSQSTINAAYDNAREAVQARAAATGATVSAADTANATSDQANAVQRSALTQQSALTQNSAVEANERRSNLDTATASDFQGADAQNSIAQTLADNQAKLRVQQSTEDAQRRQSALQYALQMQSSDRDQANTDRSFAAGQAQNSFSNSLALANAKLSEASAVGSTKAAAQKEADAQVVALQKAQTEADAAATAAATKKNDTAAALKSKRASLYLQLLKQYNGDATKANAALKDLGY